MAEDSGAKVSERGRRRVFISYSQGPSEHDERVRGLADELEAEGFEARWDRLEVPEEGWPRWCRRELSEADFILVVCTEEYCRKFEGNAPGGANWEGFLTEQLLYEDDARNLRFVPVTFGESEVTHVPLVLRATTHYVLPDQESVLFERLRSQPVAKRSPIRKSDLVRKRNAAGDAELRLLQEQKKELALAGADISEVNQRILARRRQLRDSDTIGRGTRLERGRYELAEAIKSGGFGTVWKAWDYESSQVVAIKVLHHQYSEDRSRRERFFRGARLMAKLEHPSVVRVLQERGEEGSAFYFAMEYLRGGDLGAAVSSGRIGKDDAVDALLQVGEALAYAHANGVIHRDVKPENILIGSDGRLKLTDFDLGLAADTTGGTAGALGTFLFAPFEQMNNAGNVDARADVYALGMVAQFILHGEALPPDVITETKSFRDRLDWPSGVRPIVERACQTQQAARYASMEEMCGALRELLTAPEHPRTPPEPTDRDSDERTFLTNTRGQRALYRKFLETKQKCGEPVDEMTYEEFVAELQRERHRAIREGVTNVAFSVNVKDGRAALQPHPGPVARRVARLAGYEADSVPSRVTPHAKAIDSDDYVRIKTPVPDFVPRVDKPRRSRTSARKRTLLSGSAVVGLIGVAVFRWIASNDPTAAPTVVAPLLSQLPPIASISAPKTSWDASITNKRLAGEPGNTAVSFDDTSGKKIFVRRAPAAVADQADGGWQKPDWARPDNEIPIRRGPGEADEDNRIVIPKE